MTEPTAMPGGSPPPLLVVRDAHKRYGGVRALRGANLVLPRRGAVHTLVGENGSGKSTMIGLLSGQVRLDAGSIELDGERVAFTHPLDALRRRIVTVTQETTLAPDLSIAENIFLGRRQVHGRAGIRWGATNRRAAQVLERLELDLDPAHTVRRLRPDQQQLVEIARALSMDARILILDEPTSSLTDDEVEALFGIVRRLAREGVTTLFVSHRLEEVFALADEVTVLRDGRTAEAGPLDRYDESSLIAAMVGREQDAPPPRRARVPRAEAVLSLRDVRVADAVRGVSLDVAPGEIVGLTGLVGAGRSELLEAIFGARERSGGTIAVDGREVACTSPGDAIRERIAFVPSDRRKQGLVLQMSIRENLLMATTCRRARVRRPTAAAEEAPVASAMAEMRIRAASPDVRVGTLSGGNQQKVVLGKWLATDPRVLLLDEPTRGVDVGAKSEIYRLVAATAATGVGVLVSSSETPELLAVCDRILVLFRGELMAEMDGGHATEELIAHYATGHR